MRKLDYLVGCVGLGFFPFAPYFVGGDKTVGWSKTVGRDFPRDAQLQHIPTQNRTFKYILWPPQSVLVKL